MAGRFRRRQGDALSVRRRTVILALWLLGILAPMAWFSRFSTESGRVFAWIFGPAYMHVITHAFLFAVLAYLLATMLRGRVRGIGRITAWTLGLVLTVAILQERVQLWYKNRPFGSAELFDLGVDLAGAGLGLALFWLQQRARHNQAG